MLCAGVGVWLTQGTSQFFQTRGPGKGGAGKEEQRMQVSRGVSTAHWGVHRDFMEVVLFAVGFNSEQDLRRGEQRSGT